MSEPALAAEEFTAELRGLSRRYWGEHPFHLRLHAGELSREELRRWAANRWYYQSVLPRKDAAIIANCPEREVRRLWVERIGYHDGRNGAEGGADRWLRLCAALGLERDEVVELRHLLPGVRFAVDAYVNFARDRPWLEAVASGLTEMFSGHLMRRRFDDMLAAYDWIDAADLAYFSDRVSAVSDEGRTTLDIVVRYSRTRAAQRAAVAALSFKCDVLWSMLDAIAAGPRR